MKSYVRNTINLSCAKILLTSVICTPKEYIVRLMKSEGMGGGEHAICMGEKRNSYMIMSRLDNLKDKDFLEDLRIHGRIILKWISQK